MRSLARLSIFVFVEPTTVAICGNWVDLTSVVLSCSINHVFVPYFDLVLEKCCFSERFLELSALTKAIRAT